MFSCRRDGPGQNHSGDRALSALEIGVRGRGKSSLLVVPASLIANWKVELSRFGPSLSVRIVHPSERNAADDESEPEEGRDLVITTYTMLARLQWLRRRERRLERKEQVV
jgi:SNF2 family DNA or RNA helicase